MGVQKAVIPAAGFGTRMLPVAKAVPKELLPVLDRPVIQYVVEEAADAGACDVLLVTSREKRAIEDHFDRAPELEARLAAAGRSGLLESVTRLAARVKVHAVRQPRPAGLGDAILQARRHTGAAAFLCLLGDTIFSGPGPAAQLAAAHERLGTAVIGVELVPADRVSRYGIVGGREIEPGVLRVEALVEKPTPAAAPGRHAIAARYVLTPEIYAALESTRPDAGGEVQLTDALAELARRTPVHAVVLDGRRHDIGNVADWLATNLLYAARDPQTWSRVAPAVEEAMRTAGGV